MNKSYGFPKGTVSPLVGFLGATPLNRRSQAAKFLIVLNGARGEKCDSISRGSDHERFPLLQLRNKLISEMCQWHISDVLYLYNYTKAATSLLLGNFSLAEISSFEAVASKFTF